MVRDCRFTWDGSEKMLSRIAEVAGSYGNFISIGENKELVVSLSRLTLDVPANSDLMGLGFRDIICHIDDIFIINLDAGMNGNGINFDVERHA